MQTGSLRVTEHKGLADLVTRAAEVHLRLYRGLLDLSLQYVRELTTIVRGTPVQGATPPAAGGILVLEAAAPGLAQGTFLVTNRSPSAVPATMQASSFADPDGNEVRPEVRFDPAQFELKRGERQLVKVTIPIDALPAGVGYRGVFTIAEMNGCEIPVVLRRRHAQASQRAKPATPAASPPPSPSRKSVRSVGSGRLSRTA